MYLERWITLIAGRFLLSSLSRWYLHHHYWYFFTVFVGLNLLQSGFTNWCLMEDILRKLGVKEKGQCCSPSSSEEE